MLQRVFDSIHPATESFLRPAPQPFSKGVWGLIFGSLGASAIIMVLLESGSVRAPAPMYAPAHPPARAS